MTKIDASMLFEKFVSTDISAEEMQDIIHRLIEENYPGATIRDLIANDDGLQIILDNGEVLEIDIDWDEFLIH